MSSILALITGRLAGPVLGGLLAIALAFSVGQAIQLRQQTREIARLHEAVVAANDQVVALASERQACKAQLLAQNAQIEAWRTGVDAKLGAAQQIAELAQRGRAAAETQAAQLLALKRSGQVCPDILAADAALLETLR